MCVCVRGCVHKLELVEPVLTIQYPFHFSVKTLRSNLIHEVVFYSEAACTAKAQSGGE